MCLSPRSLLRFLACSALSAIALAVAPIDAHEIPSDVTVRLIAAQGADRLRVAVRAPLEAMRDTNFPTRGPGYLDIEAADTALRNAAQLWLVDAIEVCADGQPLSRPQITAVRVSIPSDRSFTSFAAAQSHARSAPLPADTELIWSQALIDVLLEVPVPSSGDVLAIAPAFERLGLRVRTVVRFEAPDGTVRLYQYEGDPGLIELDPRWHSAATRFIVQGFAHILSGFDHLLFLLCLVLPFHGRLKALVVIITAFTLGHSVTLIGAAYGLAPASLWFAPTVEALIAASIFYMALENVIAPNLRVRWILAVAFGLVHGFGFSSALRDTLQFAGGHHLVALLSFNLGVELGQLLVLVLLVPVLHLVLPRVASERLAIVVISVIIGHTAWHWMADRFAVVSAYARQAGISYPQ
jgi:hypothetical protein